MKNVLTCCLFLLLFSCAAPEPNTWAGFMACGGNECVREVVDVKDEFILNPKPMLEAFIRTNERGEDHFIAWLYILRDSVIGNPVYGPADARIAIRNAVIEAAAPYAKDKMYGEFATSIVGELSQLMIQNDAPEEDEEGPSGDPYYPTTGVYGFELPAEGGVGSFNAQQKDAEHITFDLMVTAGPPAHNMGTIEGEATLVKENTYEYTTKEYGGTCTLQFKFTEKGVSIKTNVGDAAACGFGNGVKADGIYDRKSFDSPYLKGEDAATAKQLLGTWVSTTDAKAVIEIKDGQYKDIYDKEVLSQATYQYYPICPKDCPTTEKFPCLAVSAQDVVCFAVVKVDKSQLQLSPVGGRGNTLTYKRK